MPSNARRLSTILTGAVAVGLFAAACGGTSDSDRTATATATALRSLAAENETVGFYMGVFQGLSDEVKGRLDAAGIGEAGFATALGTFDLEVEPDAEAIAEVFEAIGDLEVTFLPSRAMTVLTNPGLLRATIAIDDATAAAVRSGDAFLTSSQLAQLFSVLDRFIGLEGEQGEDATDIDTEEVVAFFASLPDDVKQELEAAGWTEERIVAFVSEAVPAVEELRSLLLPLSDVPVPPFQAQVQALLGLLDALPSVVTAPLTLQLGQDAIDELKAGARPPTGGEFLALIEFALRLSG